MGEAKAIGVILELGLDESKATIEGMILVDLRAKVGSKKTGPDMVSFVAETWRDLSYQVSRAHYNTTQCLRSSKSSDCHLTQPDPGCAGPTVR